MSSSTPPEAGKAATAPADRRRVGLATEQLAARYLHHMGLSLVQTNYHCRLGEIDLIMRDADSLVFVEVRYRQDAGFVCPVSSINRRKQQKLLRTAQVFLKHHGLTDRAICRFDVLGISGQGNDLVFNWIKDAIRPGF